MKPGKNYSQQPEDESDGMKETSQIAAEPSVAYGIQRYSYADYLTWTDDRMREINGRYNEGTTYELINGASEVPVRTPEGLVIDLVELFED